MSPQMMKGLGYAILAGSAYAGYKAVTAHEQTGFWEGLMQGHQECPAYIPNDPVPGQPPLPEASQRLLRSHTAANDAANREATAAVTYGLAAGVGLIAAVYLLRGA